MPFSFLDSLKEWTKPQSPLPEPVSLTMVTPLAIYDNEDVNEGSTENLLYPLGNSLDKSVARTVASFLHFVCRSLLIRNIYHKQPKIFIFHEDPLMSWPLSLQSEISAKKKRGNNRVP